jgi:hypothetical protein
LFPSAHHEQKEMWVSADDDFGDLVYVSQLKVERMHATLKLPPWRRVRSVEFKVPGGPGIGAELDTDRANLIAKLRAVTDAIYGKYAIRYYYDPLLRPGAWFVGRMDGMAYGWGRWDHCPEDGDMAFFTGSDDDRLADIVLGGSLQHMLDRELPRSGARTGSTTERFRQAMSKIIAVEEDGRDAASVPKLNPAGVSGESLEDNARSSARCIDEFLARNGGRTSLIFMARAIDVFEPREGHSSRRLVTGTPLYVGIWDHEEPQATRAAPLPRPSMTARVRAMFRANVPEPVVDCPAPSHPPTSSASDDRAPSLDIALYVRPSSVASYGSPSDYYDASPRVRRRRPDSAAGEIDFLSHGRWYDEQGGEWLVSFSTYGGAYFDMSPETRGEVVATSVGSGGTNEVLVLIADVRLGDVERSLAGHADVPPRLKWLVDRLPHNANQPD